MTLPEEGDEEEEEEGRQEVALSQSPAHFKILEKRMQDVSE